MSETTEHDVPAPGDPDPGHEHARGTQERCPSCGALRPPAVAWCTQCYARFDAPDPLGAPTGGAEEHGARVDGATGAAGAPVAATPGLGPAHPVRDDTRPPADPQEVEARAAELLARLSTEGDDGDRVRSWSGRVQGRGPKVGLVLLGTALLTGLLFGAMAVLGALL